MTTARGELLVDWGNAAALKEEGGDNRHRSRSGATENEDRQVPKEDHQVPHVRKDEKEEKSQHAAIVRLGGSSVDDRCITVNPHEVALRRVSDITTYDFDGDEDLVMDECPGGKKEEGREEPTPPSVAFKKTMRSLSIAEEPLEEKEFDDW